MPRGIPNSGPKATKTTKRRKRRRAKGTRTATAAGSSSPVSVAMSMEDLGTVVGRAVREVLKT